MAATRELDIEGLAAPPRRNGELAFSEPWESRAFGLAVALDAAGVIEWEAFRQRLITAVGAWEATHAPGADSWSYWRCWQDALETLLAAEGVLGDHEVDDRSEALAARPAGHDHDHGD
ncbi:MAG: nitrile hydratase accessory protein [Acidimicrobiales bacterium]